MSGNGETRQEFGGGHFYFRFGLDDLQELQEATNKGPERILNDIRNRDWEVADIFHTIRIGLIGALDKNKKFNGDPEAVRALCELYIVKRRAWLHYKTLAMIILAEALTGDPTEKKKKSPKKPAPKVTKTKTPADSGTSEQSTRSAPPPE